MITIKELAQELNVSEQALRSWCKRNEIKKTTKGKITSYFLDDNAVESIRSYYTSQRKRNTTNTQRKHNESDHALDVLQAQITEKDKQISALTSQVQSLIADAATEREKERNERQAILSQLFSLQADNKELQTELNKYKAIADSKQTVVEVEPKEKAPAEDQTQPKEPASTPEPEQKELAEDPSPQKLSFFQRLFSKRSE